MRNKTTRIRATIVVLVGATSTALGAQSSAAHPRADANPPSAPIAAVRPASGPDLTSHAYFVAVLKRMHLRVSQANLDGLYAVEHREGDNDRYNPLNVIQPEPGSHAYNSIGVQRYANFATGVEGTAHLLSNGHWTRVRAALRKGDSTSAVLAAFSAAYTWSGGIHFQTERAMLDAEAVRDVGGKYASTSLAAHRANEQQAGLKAAIRHLTDPLDAAISKSAAAHADWAQQQPRNLTASTTAAAQGRVTSGLQDRASRERQLFVSAITSQYMSGGGAAQAGQLLDSTSPSDYLSYLTLQRYVTDDQRAVLVRYAAMQRQADVAAATLAKVQAVVHTTGTAMTDDQKTWTTADTRAVSLRARLVTLLRTAMTNSITQPVAADELAKVTPATHAGTKSTKKTKHAKRTGRGRAATAVSAPGR